LAFSAKKDTAESVLKRPKNYIIVLISEKS